MSKMQPQMQMEDDPALDLEPPTPVVAPKVDIKNVSKKAASEKPLIRDAVNDAIKHQLDLQVEELLKAIEVASPHSEEFKSISSTINSLGNKEVRESSNMSNMILQKRLVSMKSTEEGSNIAVGLVRLRKEMDRLDPTKQGKILSKGFLFDLPIIGKFFDRADDFVQMYNSSQDQLNAIMEVLYNGKNELIENNVALEHEKGEMWTLMGHLEQHIYVVKKIAERLDEKIPDIEAEDPLKAKIIKEELQFPVTQKHMDLSSHLATTLQGYHSFNAIIKNNEALKLAVDRATTTTMSQLRTALITAQALHDQKSVLETVEGVNKKTEELMRNNAKMLKEQGVAIHKQATEAAVSPQALQEAFKNIFEALDAVENYKVESIKAMKENIAMFEEINNEAKSKTNEAKREQVKDVVQEIMGGERQEDAASKLNDLQKKLEKTREAKKADKLAP